MNRTTSSQENDPNSTRSSLLSRMHSWDDQEGWRDFFETYWRLIYSAAIQSGLNESEAQDVVQETLISTAKNINKFKRRARGSFRAWLRNLTQWRIVDQLRKRSPVDSLGGGIELANVSESAEAKPNTFSDDEWQKNLFEAAIERVKLKVKEEHYQIFDLRAIQQLPAAEVAEVFGVSSAQVYLIQRRVSDLVKKEVRKLEQNLF